MNPPDSSQPPPLPQRGAKGWTRIGWILGGIICGNLVTLMLYLTLIGFTQALPGLFGEHTPSSGTSAWGSGLPLAAGIPSLLLVPICGGLMAAWIWRELRLSIGAYILCSLLVTLLALGGAAIVLGEGVICLVIASPILWAAITTGALLGRIWFRPRSSRLNLLIVPAVALMAAGEVVTRTDTHAVVVDEVLIHAPPDKVWPHVLAFQEIQEAPSYWLFRLGLPYPVATTNGGNHVGADRQCIFSDGIVVKERVAEYVPNQRLTFDIVEQLTHPEAYGHITLHRGRFDLRDNGDGTTTLIGSSWYTLHVSGLLLRLVD